MNRCTVDPKYISIAFNFFRFQLELVRYHYFLNLSILFIYLNFKYRKRRPGKKGVDQPARGHSAEQTLKLIDIWQLSQVAKIANRLQNLKWTQLNKKGLKRIITDS